MKHPSETEALGEAKDLESGASCSMREGRGRRPVAIE